MLLEFKWYDYLAWAISLGAVFVLICLFIWDGYTAYKEEERRRQRKGGRQHG